MKLRIKTMCITKNTIPKIHIYIQFIFLCIYDSILLKQSLELQFEFDCHTLIDSLMTRRGAVCEVRMLHCSLRANSLIGTANKQFL